MDANRPSANSMAPMAPMAHAIGSGFAFFRNKLLAGVAVLIPLVATLWVLNLAYRFITGISAPFLRALGIDYPVLPFLITLLALFLAGVMATNVLGRRLIAVAEGFMLRVPLVAAIYGVTKQVMESIRKLGGGMEFKRVVYVEYPSPGCRLIGFVTGSFIDRTDGRPRTTVFLPTAPNPMTGFVVVVESGLVVESNLGLEEATKVIFSGGLVAPGGPGLPAADPDGIS